MQTFFIVIVGVCLFFSSMFDKPEDNRVVNLGSAQLEQIILDYNNTTDADIELSKSVGNHGRYKNIGYDAEFFKRGFIIDKERKKGLRWYTKYGHDFIYMKSIKTDKFIQYLEVKHGGQKI